MAGRLLHKRAFVFNMISDGLLLFSHDFRIVTGPAARVFHVSLQFMREIMSISPYVLFSLRSEDATWKSFARVTRNHDIRKSYLHRCYSHFTIYRYIITELFHMVLRKFFSFLMPFVAVCAILGASALIIAYGRGYRFDLKNTSVKPTGLVSATSDPIGAQVLLDGKLKTATNNSFGVDPGWYTVTISKEGYISWQKKLRVQGEIVARADAFLFPANPSLSPLTTLGIKDPLLSPDGTKIAYMIPQDQLEGDMRKKAGLWIYELAEGPLGRNRDPIQLAEITDIFDVTHATILWSPDSTEVLAQLGINYRLYPLNRPKTYQDVTTTAGTMITEWNQETQTKITQQMDAFPRGFTNAASASARILAVSPDETKVLYEATASATIPQLINPPLIGINATKEDRSIQPGNIYIYDTKEDKNFFITSKKDLPPAQARGLAAGTIKPIPTESQTPNNRAANIHWFPTSKHLILTLKGKIDIMEYDRTNWVTIYSGPFEDGFVAPWSNGSRIIIVTNLNPNTSALPNLYTVNLR